MTWAWGEQQIVSFGMNRWLDGMQGRATTDQIPPERGAATGFERDFPQSVIDSLPCGFFALDREGRFVRCNAGFLATVGYSAPEIGSMRVFDIALEGKREDLAEAVKRVFDGDTVHTDLICRVKGGRMVSLDVIARCVMIEGAPFLIGTGWEAIPCRPAEQPLTAEAYHAIVDHSLQGLLVVQDRKVVFANSAMERIAGYSAQEIKSASADAIRDFIHPQDREKVWRTHEKRLRGEMLPDQYEFRVIRKDGAVRWLQIYTSRVEYQGRPAIQAAFIDTTERRWAEEALRRSESRNQALLDANPDLMFRLSQGGVFLDCKPSKDDKVSVSPAQFIGKHLDDVYPATLTRTLMHCIEMAVRTGRVQTVEYMLPAAEGEGTSFECRLVACAEQEVLAIVRDVSERKRAEHLAKLQRDLAIKLSSLSDLKEGLQYCLEAAVKASQMDCGGIYMLDQRTGGLRLEVHAGLPKELIDQMVSYPADSQHARMVCNGEPIYTAYEMLIIPGNWVRRAEGWRAIGVIPVKYDERVLASLNVASHTSAEVPPWSRVILETIAGQIGCAINRLETREALLRAEQEKAVILNTIPQIVVYHDLAHRIVWANRAALEALGQPAAQIVGRPCYEVWDGRAQPCEGCPVDLALRSELPQEAEIIGYNDGNWLVRAEPVRDERGRLLGVVEHALDITHRKRDEEKLRRRLQFEELVASISTDLANLSVNEVEAGIERALAGIGRFAEADRSYVYLLHDDGVTASRAHVWCAEGVDLGHQGVLDLETCRPPVGFGQSQYFGVLNIPSVQRLQDSAAEARKMLESTGVKSLLSAPIAIGGELFGYLGLSAVRWERTWSEDIEQLLKVAAELLANAMERKRSAQLMQGKLAFGTLLSELSAAFINLSVEELDKEIERWLARVGQFLGIDRGAIIHISGVTATVTHSWVADGLAPAVPTSDVGLDWSVKQLRQGNILAYSRIEDAPPEAEWEKEYCRQHGIQSIFVMSLEVAGSMLGIMMLSSVRTRCDWPEELIQQLRLVGQVFTNAMLRCRTEQALRASEAHLRSILRATPAGIGLISNRVLLEVNDRFCEVVGYRREELVNKDSRFLYPTQEEYELVGRESVRQIKERGEGVVEARWKRRDGSIIDVLFHSAALDVADLSKGITFAVLDITSRKKAEMRLQESETRFRQLGELLPQTVFEMDLKGNFTFVNRAGLKAFDYTETEAMHANVLDVIAPSDHERALENIHKRLAGLKEDNEEYIARRKDGCIFPTLLYSTPILCGGKPAGLRGLLIDITEHKRAEAALRESEQNYREIFNASNDAIFLHDTVTGEILDMNKTAFELFGYGTGEMSQFNLEAAGTGESSYTRQNAVKWIRKTAEEGPQLFEWLTKAKNGDLLWEEISLRPVVLGGHRRVLAVARNITDRKRAETQAQQHLAELTRAWHANMLGEMASGLAHELNQPLCAIVNYANGCLRLTRRPNYSMETVKDTIERIAHQSQRAADIVKRIRSLIGRREPQRMLLDMESILADAVYMLREEALAHNVVIVSRLQTDLPRIKGDDVEIEQVVLNLMRNAMESMNDPKIAHRNLTVSSCLTDRREIEIAVQDTGRGIPPELSEKVFDSFFTTKPGGLGIGLSLSRRIIEAHDGRLWVESDGRSGATFRFTLPIEGDTHGEG